MGKLYSFILGLAIGAGFYHLAMHNYVVQASDGWHFVGKSAPGMNDVYVDIREFTPADWLDHPQLAADLQRAGLGNLMTEAVGNAVEQGFKDVLAPPEAADPPL